MNTIELTSNIAYLPEVEALINFNSSPDIFEAPSEPITTTAGRVAPWGADNDLPARVLEKIRKNDVVGANLLFNQLSGYGLGIKPMKRVIDNGKLVGYDECLDDQVLRFFEDNDIAGYFMEQVNDMMTFFNVFPEIIVNPKGDKIVSLRHLEATFSRWGSMESRDNEIKWHYYNQWDCGVSKGDIIKTPVLSRYNSADRLRAQVAKSKDRRYVLQVHMPTPGRTYYSQPNWWSIFLSGWYDIAEMLPMFKKALIKNHLAIRYIIHVSNDYWIEQEKLNNVSGDPQKAKELRERLTDNLVAFLSEETNKGGALISTMKNIPAGNTVIESKYIKVETIDSAIKGGEFLEDVEEASSVISYTMGVHSDLNGSTPGKNKGSLGGSNKRELMMINQAMKRPYRDRLLMPLTLIKRYNNWDPNIVFAVPDFEFPTLDVNKAGKQETIQNP